VTVRPQNSPLIARFSPAFWATFLPGSVSVPLAERIMLVIRRSSTTTVLKVSASSLVVWCCQSTARRLAFGRRRAIWS
jgi:hypothetical protein